MLVFILVILAITLFVWLITHFIIRWILGKYDYIFSSILTLVIISFIFFVGMGSCESSMPIEEKTMKPDSITNSEDPIVIKGSRSSVDSTRIYIDGNLVIDKGSNDLPLYSKLLEGGIAHVKGMCKYYVPDSMTIREMSTISLSIGGDSDYLENRTLELSKIEPSDTVGIVSRNITIGRKMRAKLVDPMEEVDPVFKIVKPIEEQIVDLENNKSVDWIWKVYPLKEGQHGLMLALEVLLKNDLGENYTSIPIFDDDVVVYVDNSNEVTEMQPTSMRSYATKRGDDINPKSIVDTLTFGHQTQYGQKNTSKNSRLLPLGFGMIAIVLVLYFGIRYFNSSSLTKQSKAKNETVSQILKLIQDGKVATALEKIIKSIPQEEANLMKDATAQLSRWNRITKDREFGNMGEEDFNIESSRITQATITLLNELKNKK